MPERWLVRVAPEPPRLGETLARLRRARGLHQRDVAKQVGLAVSTISQYEINRAPVPGDLLRRLAALYQVEAEELFKIEAEHDLWQRMREPLPGPAVAVPNDPEMVALLEAIKGWAAPDIYALAKSAAKARRQPPAKRAALPELTDEDWDGHDRVAG